jgi:hypothetical protein
MSDAITLTIREPNRANIAHRDYHFEPPLNRRQRTRGRGLSCGRDERVFGLRPAPSRHARASQEVTTFIHNHNPATLYPNSRLNLGRE